MSRKSDGLIFCEYMNSEEQDKNYNFAKNKTYELIKNISGGNKYNTVNIDSQLYIVHYKINENVVYTIITNNNFSQKLAYKFIEDIINCFIEELKNTFGSQTASFYTKLETINKAKYFVKFDKVISKKMEEYNNKEQDNVDKLNREISDVHQIMAENINLIMDREKSINIINSLSESIKDDSGKFKKVAYQTRLKMMLSKYGIYISIVMIIVLIVVFKIYF